MGIPRPPRASWRPLPLRPPMSRASGQPVMPWRSGMNRGSPVSWALTPTKATWPSSSRATLAQPGSSASQAVHQEAKKFTTTGVPSKSARRMRPSPWSAGRSKAPGSVEPSPSLPRSRAVATSPTPTTRTTPRTTSVRRSVARDRPRSAARPGAGAGRLRRCGGVPTGTSPSSQRHEAAQADRLEPLLEPGGDPDETVEREDHPERGQRGRRGGGETGEVALDPAQRAGQAAEGQTDGQERHAEPGRVDGEQQGAAPHTLLGGGDGQDRREHRPDARRPPEPEGDPRDRGGEGTEAGQVGVEAPLLVEPRRAQHQRPEHEEGHGQYDQPE